MDKKLLIILVFVFVAGVVVGLMGGYLLWKYRVVCASDQDGGVIPVLTTTTIAIKESYGVAMVTKVTDGDTLVLANGETVRLLGINAPERGEKCSLEASARLKELVSGKEIRMEKDIEERDQYGRLLRYVYLDSVLVNEEIVRGGYAHVYLYNDTIRHKDLLMAAEREAKEAGRCIWATCLSQCGECLRVEKLEENAPGDDCENLNGEYVVFKNSCAFSCELTGWTVKDEASRTPYEFPDFILKAGAMVRLYTGCGVNTNLELYWCSSGRDCNAIWNNGGDTLYLRDSQDSLCLEHSY